ncbi:response regulator [Paenibacillus arenilitoris]|uniref:Response regulator n=1 Tax=Paenibacillus arenilitoris TaxID=2772299 RepID=A0A927CQC3_9BACL|nr:response regulator [Paenibacillus arenilitoris]MBD2870863.1 response regulator [Paenibacillus arenilitoris]
MYKVLLVDDEADVRDGLVHEIDWEACGFAVAGTAENGKEAMELAERLEPDVVITDISMPFTDGLQLSEWLRVHCPLAKIVILTGYDEFDYARQAIRLSVDEYLLKPFSSDSFTELLLKIKGKIEAEVAEREDVRQLKEHYRTSLPLLRETFLASLLTRKLPRSKIEEKAKNYGLRLFGARYAVAVIALHPPDEDGDAGAEHSLRNSGDLDLMLHAMLNIAKELWEQQNLGSAFIHQDGIALLAVDEHGREEAWLRGMQETLETILKSIVHYLKLPVTIGVGSIVGDLADVKDSFGDALAALDYRLVLGSGKVIFIHDVEDRSLGKLRFDELKEQALVRSLKVGTAEELGEAVDAVFCELRQSSYAYSDMQVYLLEAVTAVMRTAKDADINLDELYGTGFQPHAEIFKFSGLQEAQRWFLEFCLRVMKHISSKRQHAYKDIVEKAIRYTKEHYGDPDISIQKLCARLHISTGYFSGVFKKEVKMTFVQYLLHIRMEAAMELLRTTELKAFEIAERVGFADPNYFSFSFKKQVGVSPKEYRSRSLAASDGEGARDS